jgi:anti-anti-sigma factor
MSELARVEVELGDELCVVRVRGEVDISNAQLLLVDIAAAVPNGVPTLALDLSGTTYLDSAGVQLLFLLAERLKDRRHTLRLIVPKDAPIRSVLEMTGLQRLVPLEAGPPN